MVSDRAGAAALAFVSLFSLVVLEGQALADPTPAERETARGLMSDGRQKRERSDLAAALMARSTGRS